MERPRDARRRPDDVQHNDDDNRVPPREWTRQAKRDALQIDIAARLGPVCQHLTDDEFAQLVSDVADTKLRFAEIDMGTWPRRGRDDGPTGDPPTASADV